jgi:hypothetical protein
MVEHDALDLTRLERMEQRLQALEDAEAIRNLKSRYAALCDDNYDADGIAALLLRMRPGKAQVSVGSKARSDQGVFSGCSRDLLVRHPLQPERPDLCGWRSGTGAVVSLHALYGGRPEPRHVACQH